MSARHTALHDRHEALGAKFADFSGWDMPIEYAGAGVIKEHTAVRETVGLFDVEARKLVLPTPEWLKAVGLTPDDATK